MERDEGINGGLPQGQCEGEGGVKVSVRAGVMEFREMYISCLYHCPMCLFFHFVKAVNS